MDCRASCFNPSEIFCVPASTRSTFTVISSPGFATCEGSAEARRCHLRDVQQSLNAAAKFHKCAGVADRHDVSGDHRTLDD